MARASYIWIAFDVDGGSHAFTVKHELVTWLKRTDRIIDWVSRVPDGRDSTGEEMTYDVTDLVPLED
jgi:hypothetical protein